MQALTGQQQPQADGAAISSDPTVLCKHAQLGLQEQLRQEKGWGHSMHLSDVMLPAALGRQIVMRKFY